MPKAILELHIKQVLADGAIIEMTVRRLPVATTD
jgi:hypothetical protein